MFLFFTCPQCQDEDSQMVTEVDLFISTKAVKVLNADTQVCNGQPCIIKSKRYSERANIYIKNNWIIICVFYSRRKR